MGQIRDMCISERLFPNENQLLTFASWEYFLTSTNLYRNDTKSTFAG